MVNKEENTANINNCFTNITTHLKLKTTKIDCKANPEIIANTSQNHEILRELGQQIFILNLP